ncbi:unnamed protein product, partial [Brassica oleracea var. botrytis]
QAQKKHKYDEPIKGNDRGSSFVTVHQVPPSLISLAVSIGVTDNPYICPIGTEEDCKGTLPETTSHGELISRMVQDKILIVKKVKLQVEKNFKDDFEGQVGNQGAGKKGCEEVQRVRLSLNNCIIRVLAL